MDSLILTYAPADAPFARYLAEFVEANLPLSVSCTESVVAPDLDLIEATERALSAEAALVLLSPRSVPKVWNRKTWEPVFIDKPKQFQTHLGFVLLSDCAFPPLLRRQRFFDASLDPLSATREIKRWLLRPMTIPAAPGPPIPEFDEIRCAIADRPGTIAGIGAESANNFSNACREDFEAVYRFDFRSRTRTGIVGDIGSALGLPMSGTVEENRANVAQWCTTHRVLFVLANLKPEDRDFATFGGRASVIFTDPLADVLPGAIPTPAANAVRRFDETLRIDHGWTAINLLKVQERHAEVLELLGAMSRAAHTQADANALRRIEREQFWLRGGDGQLTPGPIPAPNDQLTLPFDSTLS